MATYIVTPANWNDPSFWCSIDLTSPGHTLDFSSLGSDYSVNFTGDSSSAIEISDGSSTFTVVDTWSWGADAQLGGTTSWTDFTEIFGTQGDDILDGGDGDDTLSGGKGDDILYGGEGDDHLIGNAGEDTLYGNAGNDELRGHADNDTLHGGDGNDQLYGDEGDDTIFGDAGNDELYGGEGNDELRGNAGEDKLFGRSGDDSLFAGKGDDILEGGEGSDTLTGGQGDDSFIYVAGDGADTIIDFNAGNTGTISDNDSSNNDFIDLSGFYDDIWELHADQADDGVLNQSNEGVDGADYSDNTQFETGDSLTFTGASADGSFFTVENTGVICFVAGTGIVTLRGEVPVEQLRPGDRVLTADNGFQPVAWIGRRHVPLHQLLSTPKLRPIRIHKEAFNATRDLYVSHLHGIQMGQHLIRAKHLLERPGSGAERVDNASQVMYFHLFFERHEIVFANGVPAESLYPGPEALKMLGLSSYLELLGCDAHLNMGKSLDSYGATARPFLKRREIREQLPQKALSTV